MSVLDKKVSELPLLENISADALVYIVDGDDSYKTTISELKEAVSPDAFDGATASTAGAKGAVPAPSAGDEDKVLRGDGTWSKTSYNGTTEPSSSLGDDGDIYMQTDDNGTIINVFGNVNGEWVNFPRGGGGAYEETNSELGGVYINCCNCYDMTELNEVYEEE